MAFQIGDQEFATIGAAEDRAAMMSLSKANRGKRIVVRDEYGVVSTWTNGRSSMSRRLQPDYDPHEDDEI